MADSAAPSRKRPRTEDPPDADPPKAAECPDWATLDERRVSEAPEGEVERSKSQDGGEDEDEDMDEEEDRIQDEDFWFEDGTVILVAEGFEFRVYKGPLADHSPVLKDLFSQGGEGGEDGEDGETGEGGDANEFSNETPNVDANTSSGADLNVNANASSDAVSVVSSDSGCPTIELTDSADDLRHILRVFFPTREPTCVDLPYFYESPSLDAISATIRLGTKYVMMHLVQHTLDYLKDYYPRSFDVWRKHLQGPPGFTARHAIGVVNLARLTGEDTLLPVALLTCCGLDEAIVRGCKRADGSREQLSLDDIGLCFRAKGRLVEAAVAMCLRICSWKKTAPRCACKMKALSDLAAAASSRKGSKRWSGAGAISQEHGCRDALRSAVADLPRRVRALCGDRGGPGLLLSFEMFYGDVRDQLCKECWAMVQERDLAERRETWNRLPELLGITVEGWGHS